MTLGVAVLLLGLLMIYVGIKGKSLKNALIGKSVLAPSGSVIPK